MKRAYFYFTLVFFCCFFSRAVFSELLDISPTRVKLTKQSSIQVLRIVNRDQHPYTMQASIREWRQKDEHDTYEKTDALLVTPEIFTIEPSQTQLVRVALLGNQPEKIQGTYRLFLHQILPIPKPDDKPQDQLKIALEMILPVFVPPINPAQPDWQWSIHNVTKNQYDVILANKSDETLFIDKWELFSDKKTLTTQKTFLYILPHQAYHWMITVNEVIQKPEIKASINNSDAISQAIIQ